MSEFKASSSGSSPSKQNTEVANKEDFFANAENFIAGNIDPEEYMIVDVATQYVFTYKNKKTGSNTPS
jgi:hypothetical protein